MLGVELATQRGTSRQWGAPVCIQWVPGQSEEVDQYARYLQKHGLQNDVYGDIVDHYDGTFPW